MEKVTAKELQEARQVFVKLKEEKCQLWFIRDSANEAMLDDIIRVLGNEADIRMFFESSEDDARA